MAGGLTAGAVAGLLGAGALRRGGARAKRQPARRAVALRAALLEYPGAAGVNDAFVAALLAAQKAHMGSQAQPVLSLHDAKRLVEDVTALFKAEATLQQVSLEPAKCKRDRIKTHFRFYPAS